MRELSLHILDVAKNSTVAGSTVIEIKLFADEQIFSFEIIDNGKGMSEEFLQKVLDPYTTTRTTRKVGMGLPLLRTAAEQAGGNLKICSKLGEGTSVKAEFLRQSIDRMPLGDIGSTIALLIGGDPQIRFIFSAECGNQDFSLDTDEVKEIMQGVSIDSLEVQEFIRNFINENIQDLYGGNI